MTSDAVKTAPQTEKSRRCSVFKIDLTGRFVYIDNNTEKLLKSPAENLFGKSIEDYLDKESFGVIETILGYGRLYETFYESAALCFFDASGKAHCREVIISLNFIAGNPANYQIIIAPEKNRGKTKQPSSADKLSFEKEMYQWVASIDNDIDWKQLTDLLIEDDNIVQAAIYKYENDALEKLGDSSNLTLGGKGFNLSQTDENHLKSAKHRMPYSNKGKGKSDGLIDTCFALECSDECWGLLRLIIKEDIDSEDNRLHMLSKFIGRTLFQIQNS